MLEAGVDEETIIDHLDLEAIRHAPLPPSGTTRRTRPAKRGDRRARRRTVAGGGRRRGP